MRQRWLNRSSGAGLCALSAGTEYLVDMTADEISALEERLWELGYLSGESDGVFDGDTRSALESFQQANGLEVNGAADEATLERLDSADALSRQGYLTRFANAYALMTPLEKGSTSNDVLSVQRKLKEYGYFRRRARRRVQRRHPARRWSASRW